jgi:c-di-GMP-binding flagellar brake protein YcgR
MTLDRRKDLRVEEENQVTFSVLIEEESQKYRKISHCLTRNISLNGAMISGDTFLPVGSNVTLELLLAGHYEAITLVGKVRWVRVMPSDDVFEAGLEFVDVPPNGVSALNAHLLDQ